MEPPFDLHPQLARDTFVLAELPLSRLLLMNDAQYPWCILVPRRPGVSEVYALSQDDQALLWRESSMLGRALMTAFAGDKLNIAALGNVVPQLHVHHIVRYRTDPAWPAPVWGRHAAQPHSEAARRTFELRLRPHVTGARWQD